MDPFTIAAIGTTVANTASGLGAGEGEKRTAEERYYSGQGMKWDSWLKDLEFQFQQKIRGMRPQMFQSQLDMSRAQTGQTQAQTGLLEQMFGQRGEQFGQRRQMFDQAQGMMGKPIFDPGANMGLLNQAMQPYMKQLEAKFGRSGMGGGSLAGAFGNLQNQQMAMPMWNAQQQNAYATSNRDMNIYSMFS